MSGFRKMIARESSGSVDWRDGLCVVVFSRDERYPVYARTRMIGGMRMADRVSGDGRKYYDLELCVAYASMDDGTWRKIA